MKVAILCPGLGRTFRGYERFASELFTSLKPAEDVWLFRGSGATGERETSVGGISRYSGAARLLAAVRSDIYYWESMTFALRFRRRIADFHLLHYSEPSLNLAFTHLEKRTGERARRLFSHALNMEAAHTLRCHHIHQASPESYDAARSFGVPEERMTLLPYGVRTAGFLADRTQWARMETRRRYALPLTGPILLSVAAINRTHKRIDVLIEAVARMERRPHLLLVGALDEPALLEHARSILGPANVSRLYVSNDEIVSLYAAADMFALPSLVEGFGLGALEAQLCGLPVIVNDSPHFRWLLGNDGARFVNMGDTAHLAREIEDVQADLDRIGSMVLDVRPRQAARFDWANLAPAYIEMYHRAGTHPSTTIEQLLAA